MLSVLGQSEYGIFTLANSVVQYVCVFDVGLGPAAVRYNAQYIAQGERQKQANINAMLIIVHAFISAVALCVGLYIFFHLDIVFLKLTTDELILMKKLYLIALGNIVLSFPLSVFESAITAHERFVFLKICNLISTITRPICILSVLYCGYRSVGMIIVSTCFNLGICLINMFYYLFKLKLGIKLQKFDWVLFKSIFSFSVFLILDNVATQIFWNTDQVVLGASVGAAPIAVYQVASQLNGYYKSFSTVPSGMFLPHFSKQISLKVTDQKTMNSIVKIGRIQFMICTYILLGFALCGKQFIALWLKDSTYKPAYYVALILMVPQIFAITQGGFPPALLAKSLHKVKVFVYFISACINITSSLILVRIWGIIGCAVGTAIGLVCAAVLNNLYYLHLKMNMAYFYREILVLLIPTLISAVLGLLAARLFTFSSYFSLMLFIVMFSLIFVAVYWHLGFNEEEKELVLGGVSKILKKR